MAEPELGSTAEPAQRVWLARRVEQYESDLDGHYTADRLAGLLERLTFGRGEARQGVRPRQKVPVHTNAYGMTSNLRHAVTLYRDFRADALEFPGPRTAPMPAASS